MTQNPIAKGSLLALAAAALFGVVTPLVQLLGKGVGPFATAALLYAGAAIGAGAGRARTRARARHAERESGLRLAHAPRVALVALFGAVLAPAALAYGLQRAGALAASLLLNLEAPFTVLLAWLFYREPLGRRVLAAGALMGLGGGLLALRLEAHGASSVPSASSAFGLLALGVATFAWAFDNTLTRPLSDFDPRSVVWWKATLGALFSSIVAWRLREAWPHALALLALLACGATGFGLSLGLYLRAQRVLGAARTGSLFALAPFVGAAVAFGLGDRAGASFIVLAAFAFAFGVYLHVTESHHYPHFHPAIEHEHPHTHDDGHHTHVHDPPVIGSHTHQHRHESLEHDHPHGADVHHQHRHE